MVARAAPRPVRSVGAMAETPNRIALGPSTGAGQAYRVEAPARVLRLYAMLIEAVGENWPPDMPPQALARIQRLVETARVELERSISLRLPLSCASSSGRMEHILMPPGCAWNVWACSAGSAAW